MIIVWILLGIALIASIIGGWHILDVPKEELPSPEQQAKDFFEWQQEATEFENRFNATLHALEKQAAQTSSSTLPSSKPEAPSSPSPSSSPKRKSGYFPE